MKKQIAIIVCLICMLISCDQGDRKEIDDHADAMQEAIESAEKWLAIVDEGKYEKSWEETASIFKNAVPVDQWMDLVSSVRPPLGKILSRVIADTTYKNSIPSAPDGEYVLILFKTKFENKDDAIETVTPTKDKDGTWRVSGYYVK
jgi:hypothetical protein